MQVIIDEPLHLSNIGDMTVERFRVNLSERVVE